MNWSRLFLFQIIKFQEAFSDYAYREVTLEIRNLIPNFFRKCRKCFNENVRYQF